MNFVHLDHTSESWIRILRQHCTKYVAKMTIQKYKNGGLFMVVRKCTVWCQAIKSRKVSRPSPFSRMASDRPLSTINLNDSLNPLRTVPLIDLPSPWCHFWFDPNGPSTCRKNFLYHNLTIPFSSMYLSYLHLSSYLSTSDMCGNTIDPPPTWSNYFSIKSFEIIHVMSQKTYHIEKNVIRRTIVDGQHCEMANPIWRSCRR